MKLETPLSVAEVRSIVKEEMREELQTIIRTATQISAQIERTRLLQEEMWLKLSSLADSPAAGELLSVLRRKRNDN